MTDWIDLAIENWARWHRQSLRWGRGHCLSVEHRWRSPQPWDAPPVTGLGRPSELAAKAVEEAWKTLPFKTKMILKQWYVLRLSMWEIGRNLRKKGYPVQTRYWDIELQRAKYVLSLALAHCKYVQYHADTATEVRREAHVGGFAASTEVNEPPKTFALLAG